MVTGDGYFWPRARVVAETRNNTESGVSRRRKLSGQVAQLVEQRTENPRVGGSIPSLAIEVSPPHDPPPLTNL
jgi:hypothetical protein